MDKTTTPAQHELHAKNEAEAKKKAEKKKAEAEAKKKAEADAKKADAKKADKVEKKADEKADKKTEKKQEKAKDLCNARQRSAGGMGEALPPPLPLGPSCNVVGVVEAEVRGGRRSEDQRRPKASVGREQLMAFGICVAASRRSICSR